MFKKRVEDIDSVIKKYIEELQKQIRVEHVILFGSYAKGIVRDYSDIDIAIVSPDFEGGTERDYLLLDRAARKIHVLLEAVPYTPADFGNSEPGDFIDEILKTGRVIYKKVA